MKNTKNKKYFKSFEYNEIKRKKLEKVKNVINDLGRSSINHTSIMPIVNSISNEEKIKSRKRLILYKK